MGPSDAVKIGISPLVPVMDWEHFATLAGLEPGVVKGWIQRGDVPTVKIGKRRLINILALAQFCADCESELEAE